MGTRTLSTKALCMLLATSIFLIAYMPRTCSSTDSPSFSGNVLVNSPDIQGLSPEIVLGNDGIIHVVWATGGEDGDIYFAKSLDGGQSFCCQEKVSDDTVNATQTYASIALGPEGSVHVAWNDYRNDQDGRFVPDGGIDGINDADIYYSKSEDGGNTFSQNVKVNDDIENSQYTHHHRFISVDYGGKVHVVWSDERNGRADVYYANSTDGGLTFNPNLKVSDGNVSAAVPSLAVDSAGTIFVVWRDSRNATAGERIFLSRSYDGGESFEKSQMIDDSPTTLMQDDPEIAVVGDIVGVVWFESLSVKAYLSVSSDGGSTFSGPKRPSESEPSVPEWEPSISINNSRYIAVTWRDRRTSDYDIYFSGSHDLGQTFEANVRVNDDATMFHQFMPSVVTDDNGYVYVVWHDARSGVKCDIYFARSPSGLADLTTSSSDIVFSHASPVPYGTETTVNATIWNLGDRNASSTLVAFYDGHPGSGELIDTNTIPFVEMGGGYGYTETSWLAVQPRFHEICVSVDPSNSITESNETNNIACKTIEVIIPALPAPPGNLTAELSGQDLSNITLSWSLSPDDGGTVNMTRYDIYRDESYDIEGRQYTLIGSVPNGTSEYVDENAGEGDPDDHFYYVCAIGDMNISSCTVDQAGKFTRPLSQGPNLISIPLIQLNESMEYVLQTVDYDKAWHYDSSLGEWKWFMSFKGYRKHLWTVNHTSGVWMNVTEGSNLTVAGVVPTNTSINLVAGWNLVGFPLFDSTYSVSDLYTGIGSVRVEGYDFLSPYFLRVLEGSDELQAGCGYWVRTSQHTVWSVQVQ